MNQCTFNLKPQVNFSCRNSKTFEIHFSLMQNLESNGVYPFEANQVFAVKFAFMWIMFLET